MTTVTLDLPHELYRRAQQTAKSSQRSVEQVVIEWIQPPSEVKKNNLQDSLADLDRLTDHELIQVAQSMPPRKDTERLQNLLTLQGQRTLTTTEYHEAERLVKQEDIQTLRKAKALYILKQRGSLPTDLVANIA